MISTKDNSNMDEMHPVLDCTHPDVMGAYLSRELPGSDRTQMTQRLASDPEARELMLMSFQALQATSETRRK
ncbi:MAG: hypothetical protein HKN43_16945 [Rhodothermales bacterium]|nr:hypothetical protein [Rhodothermales bacterium]